jgi:conjugative relaxase-like TrwC/TraI family protein
VAVVATISVGHDAGYPFKGMAAGAAEGRQAGREGTGYYLNASASGEAPGRYRGEALAELGIHDGDVVKQAEFEPLFGRFADPRDPSGATTLGRPLREDVSADVRYQQKIGDGSGLTEDQRYALRTQARAEAAARERSAVSYYDVTLSVDKSISLAHATALAKAQAARDAGELDAAATWEDRAAGIWAAIDDASRVFLAGLQEHVNVSRVGHHGKGADGVDRGRFEDAAPFAAATFMQSTSRDGDPQIHVHQLILNRQQTLGDGEWRAIFSRALYAAKKEAAAKTALYLESRLSQQYGFGWKYRDASKGRVIATATDKVINAFSSRRASVNDATHRLVDAFRASYERDPTRRELHSLRQEANRMTRKGKDAAGVDYGRLLADWHARAEGAELGSLTDLAGVLWADCDGAVHELSAEAERQISAIALAQAQARSASWTRADLVSQLGQALPNGFVLAEPERAGEYLGELADRILASGQVVRLDVGEFPTVPDSLRRADGTSVYVAPGSERYATVNQLALEDALVSRAAAGGAPGLTREAAAKLIGATVGSLEAQLDSAPGDGAEVTGSGLRLEQAAAAFPALTSGRRVDVIVAAAGAGKTYTAAKMAEIWQAAGMGRVIGLALSSKGRNVLAEAGVPECYNLAEYLGHLKTEREARGPVDPGADALLILDEASQAGLADGEAVLRAVERFGSKLVTIGDTQQLSSPEAGDALGILSRHLGYTQIEEPVRFAPGWERDASLQVRSGDLRGLQAYELRGRLHGGRFESMAEQAAAMFVTEHLAGRDAACTAYSHHEVAELNRRIQDHLDRLAIRHGTSIAVGDYRARVGDLVKATENRGLRISNGDVMIIDRIDGSSVTVRKSGQHDAQTGQRVWSAPKVIPADYLAEHGNLGYATTTHTKQGDTVWTGIGLVRDDRPRQSLYPAITRGRNANHAFAYPSDPDCITGLEASADPEVARSRKLAAEAAGEIDLPEDEIDPMPLLAKVIARDGSEASATEYQRTAMAEADSIRTLFWQRLDLSRTDAAARFATALRGTLAAEQAEAALSNTDDLYRALRAAELAGMDARQVLAEAAAKHELESAASVSAVLAWRVRQIAEDRPTVRQSSEVREPEMAAFAGQLDALMAERARRVAQLALDTEADWATRSIGPVPEDAADRDLWLANAAQLGRWRELSGREDEADPLGERPGSEFPEMRAEWDRAAEAAPLTDGMDLREVSEGTLLARRLAYERETAWAPPFVSHELAIANKAATQYASRAARHDQLRAAAERDRRPALARAHGGKAEQGRAAAAKAREVARILDGLHQARESHGALVADTLRMGVAADREAHRRGLLPAGEKLASQEPKAFDYETEAEADGQQSERNVRAMLGIDNEQASQPVGEHVRKLTAIAAASRERVYEIGSVPEPELDEDLVPSLAWDRLMERQRTSVLQRPAAEVPISPKVAEHVADREGT